MNPASSVCGGSGSGTGSGARDEVTLEAKHKIFLSHSGAQKNFVEQLCVDLERCDRYPFFDKRRHSLPIGEHFPNLIFKAIRQCQVGVLILSEEFFTRTKWPMLELEAMVECKKQNSELVIMPVFLGISREQCRNHDRWESWWLEMKRDDRRINVEKWKEALSIFGPTNGLIYNEALGEVKFREEIVEAICERVRRETRWDDSHVQGRFRMCQVVREKVEQTQVCKEYGVRVIGLYGVGGLGKTTICKALCNNYCQEFKDRVAHVELESGVEVELMRGMLRKLTDTRHEVLARLDKGECTTLMKEKVHQHDVFLAVDNVSDTYEACEQTRVYLRAGFTQRSVVIVTGRSKKVLTGVGVAEEDCMKMPKLDASDALSLFLYQVPGVPDEINTEDRLHIESCVEVCRFRDADKIDFDYLPLALKLFGIHLGARGYYPKLWVEQLPDTSKDLMNPVFEILRRSFDALREEDKLLFMDVVLYFPEICADFRVDDDININIFEWLSTVHPLSVARVKLRLQELQRKSVIEELGERIGVHDLWREFAKEETKAGELECRRWVYVTGNEKCEFDDEEPSQNGWGKLRRMCFRVNSSMENCLNMTMLTKLHYYSNVTVVHVTYRIDEVEVVDITALRCLKSLMLVNLHSYLKNKDKDMRVCSKIELRGIRTLKSLGLLVWTDDHISSACMEDIAHLTSLQVLSLTCKHTDQLPDLSNLKLLQVVQLSTRGRISKISGLHKLTKLKRLKLSFRSKCTICACYGIFNLMALEELKIKGCVEVEEVFNLQKLTNLRSLRMPDCEPIKEIIGLDNLVALKYFELSCSERERSNLRGSWSLPRTSKLTNLQTLVISYQSVTALEGLSDAVSLQSLDASYCYKLRELPDMAKLTNLEQLDIRWSCVQAIPGLGELVSLRWLEAQHCSELSELPDMAKLTNLDYLDISWSCVQAIPGLGELVALEVLQAQHCSKLGELPDMAKLTNLRYLDISWSCVQAIPGLGELVALEVLHAQHCSKLGELPDMAKLTNLRYLYISWSCVQTIPGLGELVSLKKLVAQHCSMLSDIPDLQKLSHLRELDLRWCALKTVRGLDKLEALKTLIVDHCSELVALPELCKLTTLSELDVRHCSSFESIPSLENLSSWLKLKGDWQTLSKVHKLPPMLNQLKIVGWTSQGLACLAGSADIRQLTISDCRELDELNSLSELPKLEWLTLERCNFQAVPGLMNCTELRNLEIYSCGELERLPDLHRLERLKIVGEENLKPKAVFPMGNLPKLRDLECWNLEILELPDLSSCWSQEITLTVSNCGEFRSLTSNGPLTWLGSLIVHNCESLRELPDLSFCINLYSLKVISCGSLRALPDLGKCPQLSELTVKSCGSLRELPDLGECTQLRRLTVESCGSLTELPDLGKCTQLWDLTVESCGSLRALPDLGKCTELGSLDVRSCGGLREVPDLGLCTKLKYIVVSNCSDHLTRPKPSDCEESMWPYLEWKPAPLFLLRPCTVQPTVF